MRKPENMCLFKSSLSNASRARKALLSPAPENPRILTHWVPGCPGFPGNSPGRSIEPGPTGCHAPGPPKTGKRHPDPLGAVPDPDPLGARVRLPDPDPRGARCRRGRWHPAGVRGARAARRRWVRGGGGGPEAGGSLAGRYHRTRENFFKNQKPNGSTFPTLHRFSKPLYTPTHYGTRKPPVRRHGCHR